MNKSEMIMAFSEKQSVLVFSEDGSRGVTRSKELSLRGHLWHQGAGSPKPRKEAGAQSGPPWKLPTMRAIRGVLHTVVYGSEV